MAERGLVPAPTAQGTVPVMRGSEVVGNTMDACILTVAGSDSCSGAGIQADVKTATALGCHAACAVTCVTAQNTVEFAACTPVAGELIRTQMLTAAADLPLSAVKVGMLGSVEAVKAVASACRELRAAQPGLPIVVDPVLAPTTAADLDAELVGRAICWHLLPLTTLLTPNLPEARQLAEYSRLTIARHNPDGAMPPEAPVAASAKARSSWAARILLAAGARAVLVKGGHAVQAKDSMVYDLLFAAVGADPVCVCQSTEAAPGERPFTVNLELPHQDAYVHVPVAYHHAHVPGEFHGTGCVLSTAICCGLAQGHTLPDAIAQAEDCLVRQLQHPLEVGHGSRLMRFAPASEGDVR